MAKFSYPCLPDRPGIFPSGVKYINANIGVITQEDNVYYFNGSKSIYKHHKDD